MLWPADAPIPVASFRQPRAEPEIALILAETWPVPACPSPTSSARPGTRSPAIEIIDSRITDWKIGLVDTVADNASSGGLVIGQCPVAPGGRDLSLAGCVFRRNGRIVATGAGAAVLGSPLHAAAWLASELLARGAEHEPGHVILTGSITAAIPVGPGDAVTAAFDRLGSVTAVFD